MLRAGDVVDQGTHLVVLLTAAKTDRFGTGQGVVVGERRADPVTCPVRWWRRWRRMAQLNDADPAFVDVNGPLGAVKRPLVRFSHLGFAKRIRLVFDSVGLDLERYSAHSLRAGGASSMFAAGVPTEMITTMGRWTTNCFRDYIRLGVQQIASVAARMGAHLPALTHVVG